MVTQVGVYLKSFKLFKEPDLRECNESASVCG